MATYTPVSRQSKKFVVLLLYQTFKTLIKELLNNFRRRLFYQNLNGLGLKMSIGSQLVGDITAENFKILGRVHLGMYSIIAIIKDPENSPLQLHEPSLVSLGDNVYIGDQCNIRACGGELMVGTDVLIANHVTIVTSNHGSYLGTPITTQPWNEHPMGVLIEDGCWIGANAVILPGSKISKGAIIAAGAVVNTYVPPNEIWGGVPAKRISIRRPPPDSQSSTTKSNES